MDQNNVQLFEDQPIRTAWDEEYEEWYFSIIDVIRVLTDQPEYQKARKYWNKLKQRLNEEGSQLVTNCHQLKMTSQDGKKRQTDVADTEQLNGGLVFREKRARSSLPVKSGVDPAVFYVRILTRED